MQRDTAAFFVLNTHLAVRPTYGIVRVQKMRFRPDIGEIRVDPNLRLQSARSSGPDRSEANKQETAPRRIPGGNNDQI
jgi:hypothetical protein